MPQDQRYELNNPPIVAEMIEGEGVVINLKTGRYYSLLGAAAVIWGLLLAGHSPAEIAGALPGEHSVRHEDLDRFIAGLLAEELLRPSANREARGLPQPIEAFAPEALKLESFTDMQDMLTLDPIHQIDDDYGWPRPAR